MSVSSPLCPKCRYHLDGHVTLARSRCPECGWAFETRRLLDGTYERHRRQEVLSALVCVVLLGYLLSNLVLALTFGATA